MNKEYLLTISNTNYEEILNELENNLENNVEIYFFKEKNNSLIVFDCFFEDSVFTIEKFNNKIKVKENEETIKEIFLI